MEKETIKKIVTKIKSITIKDFIYVCIILLMFGVIVTSINTCNNDKRRYETNIRALTDTITYYKSKSGDLVAEKTVFELVNIDELQKYNKALYDELDDLKNLVKKKNMTAATHFNGVIENEVHDTTYIVQHDTISNGVDKQFAFNNEWRILEGNVGYHKDTLSMAITKDVTKFDYTVVTDKDNRVYIKSKNPYVKFDEFTGFTIPSNTKQPTKRWGIGPQVGVGVTTDGKFRPYIGVGIQWSPIRF